jgi:parallel beta-helix repeat protein
MKKLSKQRPKGKLERLLMWVLATLIVVNLLLLLLVQDSYLHLDWIHHSLPNISLDAVRVDNIPFIRDLVQSGESHTSAHVSIQSPTLIEPSVTSMEELATEMSNTVTPTSSPFKLNSSPSSTEITAPTSTRTPTITENPTFTPTPAPTNTPPQTTAAPSTTAASFSTYFVAPNGDDSNPGTQSQPWRTIQKAANTMTPGDTAIVLAGNYAERVFINQSGASDAQITYQAEGTVTMKGFTVYANYISLIGFDISNTDDHPQNGWGIFLEGSYCIIEENYLHYATRGGIELYASPGNYASTSHCIVRGNRLYRNAHAGIEVYGQDNLIEENEVWGTIQHHPNWENPPIWVDADGIRFHGAGHLIRRNYIHDITYHDPENINPHIDCFQTFSNEDHERAQNIIFEKNICKNVQAQTEEEFGKGFMLEGAYNIIIRNNIIEAFTNVNINSACSDITIVNNVLSTDVSLVMDFHTVGIAVRKSPNTTIKNNIFYDLPNHIIVAYDSTSEQGLDVGYNCVYRSDGKPPWGAPYPHDLWQVDPQFFNPGAYDFHLLPSSPAIDAGITLAYVIDDFDGTPRPQGLGYDIGAFEYSAQ